MYPRLASIYQVAKNDLELMILQSLPLECWDCGFYYSLCLLLWSARDGTESFMPSKQGLYPPNHTPATSCSY